MSTLAEAKSLVDFVEYAAEKWRRNEAEKARITRETVRSARTPRLERNRPKTFTAPAQQRIYAAQLHEILEKNPTWSFAKACASIGKDPRSARAWYRNSGHKIRPLYKAPQKPIVRTAKVRGGRK